MISETFRLEVYGYGERNQIIENCRTSFASNGGDILDFKMFSDMLINFIIEIPVNNILISLSPITRPKETLEWRRFIRKSQDVSEAREVPETMPYFGAIS